MLLYLKKKVLANLKDIRTRLEAEEMTRQKDDGFTKLQQAKTAISELIESVGNEKWYKVVFRFGSVINEVISILRLVLKMLP